MKAMIAALSLFAFASRVQADPAGVIEAVDTYGTNHPQSELSTSKDNRPANPVAGEIVVESHRSLALGYFFLDAGSYFCR